MALQGSFSGTTSNSRIKPTVTWSAVQSIEENYSDITAVLTYRRSNDYTTGGYWEGTLTIGDRQTAGRKYIEITDDGDTVALTATARVYHDSNGALTVTVRATGAIPGSTLTGTDISGEVVPDTIPRASTVSAGNADIGSRTTVVVSRKNSAYTHSLAYRFGALSGYIDGEGNPVAAEVKLSETAVNFLLPEDFYGQIPTETMGVCTLTCTTYDGDRVIGTPQTGEFYAVAGVQSCAPLVSGSVTDGNEAAVALTGDPGVLVRYISNALCTLDAQPQKGAVIETLYIGGEAVDTPQRVLAGIALPQVTFGAVDSRGYTGSCTVTVPMIPYVLLTNNATVRRTDPTSGEAVLTLRGSCWKGSFGAAENTLTARVQVDGGEEQTYPLTIGEDHTYSAQVALSGLDYRTAHTVQVTVCDAAMTAPRSLPVQKGIPVFAWGEAQFRFNVPVELPALTVNGTPLEEYIKGLLNG